MFICKGTGKVSKPGEKPYLLVVKTRPKTYSNKIKRKGKKPIFVESEGWEIVKEIQVCKEYYNKYMENKE